MSRQKGVACGSTAKKREVKKKEKRRSEDMKKKRKGETKSRCEDL